MRQHVRIGKKLGLLLLLALAGCAAPTSRSAPKIASSEADASGRDLIASGDRLMKHDPSRAAQYYEAAYRAGAPRVLPRLLTACVASRQYALAAEHAEAALLRDPSNVRLRGLLGSLHADTGQLAKARENFEIAAAEDVADADLQFTVAVFFRDDAHEPGRADPYFRAYLALAPAGSHAREARASLMKSVE